MSSVYESPDSERAVIAAVMDSGMPAYDVCRAQITSPEAFKTREFRAIWYVCGLMANDATLPSGRSQTPALAVVDRCRSVRLSDVLGSGDGTVFEFVGGYAGVTEACEGYAGDGTARSALTVQRLYCARQAANAVWKAWELVKRGCDDIPVVIRELQSYAELAESGGHRTTVAAFEQHGDSPTVTQLSWGHGKMDQLKGCPLLTGRLYVVGAPPGGGKTTFAVQVLCKNADDGGKVAMLSLEMPVHDVVSRCRNHYNISPEGAERMSVVRMADVDPLSLVSEVRSMANAGTKLVAIDYLQYVEPARGMNDFESIKATVKGLDNVAKTRNIAIILLSQINRAARKEADKGNDYGLADFYGSAYIEQSADAAILICPQDEESPRPATQKTVDFNIAKNRMGPVGRARWTWHMPEHRFVEG